MQRYISHISSSLFEYEANKHNAEVELYKHKDNFGGRFNFIRIEAGYHSYSDDCIVDINLYNHNHIHIALYGDDNEMHYRMAYTLSDTCVISKFIIPKGSEYYRNNIGAIVSSNIIWTGEIMNIDAKYRGKQFKLCEYNNFLNN